MSRSEQFLRLCVESQLFSIPAFHVRFLWGPASSIVRCCLGAMLSVAVPDKRAFSRCGTAGISPPGEEPVYWLNFVAAELPQDSGWAVRTCSWLAPVGKATVTCDEPSASLPH